MISHISGMAGGWVSIISFSLVGTPHQTLQMRSPRQTRLLRGICRKFQIPNKGRPPLRFQVMRKPGESVDWLLTNQSVSISGLSQSVRRSWEAIYFLKAKLVKLGLEDELVAL